MKVFKLRAWSAIAVVVMFQAPALFVVRAASSPTKAWHDNQIEQLERTGNPAHKVRVIVRSNGPTRAAVLKALRNHGVKIRRQHEHSGQFAVEVSGRDLVWLDNLQGIGAISFDSEVRPAPMAAQSIVGGALSQAATGKGTQLRASLGLSELDPTGAGVGIAVIDSGIAPVPDLAGRISAFYDFTNGQGGVPTAPVDPYGHGTHVAGLIAGSGALSNGQFEGVAPSAHLIGLRVLDTSGSGSTSDAIAAVEFATANREALGIDIINISLGHPPYSRAADDPLVQAVEAASRAGVIVVVSAGNIGVNPVTNQIGYAGILSPANAPSALAVASSKSMGTLDPTDDRIANYSSRGPTWYDGFAKPDIAAPGQNMVGPFAPDSFLGTAYPALLVSDAYGEQTYLALSGSSMAAGVESGLIAVVLEGNRALSAPPAPTAPLPDPVAKTAPPTEPPPVDPVPPPVDPVPPPVDPVPPPVDPVPPPVNPVPPPAAPVDPPPAPPVDPVPPPAPPVDPVPPPAPPDPPSTAIAPRDLSPNAIKAFMEYTAFPMTDETGVAYNRLSQGAGRVNGRGVLDLARAVDINAPVGSPWIISAVLPYSSYNGVDLPWAQNIVWAENIVWGESIISVNNIVWSENIMWGENIVWAENTVWGQILDRGEDIGQNEDIDGYENIEESDEIDQAEDLELADDINQVEAIEQVEALEPDEAIEQVEDTDRNERIDRGANILWAEGIDRKTTVPRIASAGISL